MTKSLQNLLKKYKGKRLNDIPYELKHDENYGYVFSYYGKWYVVVLDSENNSTILNIKELKLKLKH